MKDFFQNIAVSQFLSLSDSEKFLFDYMKNNSELLPSMSITSLSKVSSSSTGTIIRCVKKLGFDGYSEFKHALKSDFNTATYTDNILGIDQAIKQVIKKNELEVLNTISLLDISEIEMAVRKIFDAQKVYLFAREFSAKVASEINVKLQLMQKNAELHSDPNIIELISRKIRDTDLAILVSLTGNTSHLIEACKNFKIQNVPIILITANAESTLSQMCDIVLQGYKAPESLLPEYDVRSRLPLEVISRILIDSYIIRQREFERETLSNG